MRDLTRFTKKFSCCTMLGNITKYPTGALEFLQNLGKGRFVNGTLSTESEQALIFRLLEILPFNYVTASFMFDLLWVLCV